MSAPLRILHAHSTFALGGKEARAVRLMNAWGDAAVHTVLSATGDYAARDAVAPGIAVDYPRDAPSLVGKPGLSRWRAIARYAAGFDLVLTYNWGAMDVVGARRLFGGTPLVHHEDGFNADEAGRQKPARVWFRRLMLPAAYRVIVPSERLEGIARTVWRQPARRVLRIANGISVARYAMPPAGTLPGVPPAAGLVTVGTLAGLRGVKNLPRLVRAVAAAGPGVRLVIVGEGPERPAIEAAARAAGIADRMFLPGFASDPAAVVGHFDIFALSSDSEQFPISLIEAMAAGLPVVSTDVGDVAAMVAPANRRFVIPAEEEGAFAAALTELARDTALRHEIGAANRARAQDAYDERVMIDRYAAIYSEAAGRPGALSAPITLR